MNIFVTAIGTDSGKTLVSAILCEALHGDYWKPVQAGMPRDLETVRHLISNPHTFLHEEQYLLTTPASPHAAARVDGTHISLNDFQVPATSATLIIEGAGGCLVPLNDNDLVIDLIAQTKSEVIVVSNHYLGSINHTLLTLEALSHRRIPVKGLIFNGDPVPETEAIILRRSKLPCLLHIRKEPEITPAIVKKYAEILKQNWNG